MRAGSELQITGMIQVIIAPKSTPSTPPAAVRVIASRVNCSRMSRLRAPIAFRTPISRVRSVTATSIIFITPTPPTIKPTLDTANMKINTAPVTWFQTSERESWVNTRSEEHTSELQSLAYLVCRLLLEKKKEVHDLRRDPDGVRVVLRLGLVRVCLRR